MPLIEFAYNNNYHSSIEMATFEALYGRRCRSLVDLFEDGEMDLLGLNLVLGAMEKVRVIRERLKMTQNCHKLYFDMRRRDLEFYVGDWVYLKVLPMKGVVYFCKKGKLSPRFVGPCKSLRKICRVAYELDLPREMEMVHPIFHVSLLRKCLSDPNSIIPLSELSLEENMTYEEVTVEILDRQVKK